MFKTAKIIRGFASCTAITTEQRRVRPSSSRPWKIAEVFAGNRCKKWNYSQSFAYLMGWHVLRHLHTSIVSTASWVVSVCHVLLILLSRRSLLRCNLSMYATFELDESMQQSDQINQINQIRRLIDNKTRSLAVAERLRDGFCHWIFR